MSAAALISTLSIGDSEVTCAELSPETGKFLVVGGQSGTCSVFRVGESQPLYSIPLGQPVLSCAINHSDTAAVAGLQSGGVRIISLLSGKVSSIPGCSTAVTSLSFGPPRDPVKGDAYLALGTATGEIHVRVCSCNDSEPPGSVARHWEHFISHTCHQSPLPDHDSSRPTARDSRVTSICFSPRSVWCVSGDGMGRVVVYSLIQSDTQQPGMHREILHMAPIYTIAIHPEQRLVAVSSGDRCVRVWDLCSSDRSLNRRVGRSDSESTGHEITAAALIDAMPTGRGPQVLFCATRGGVLRVWSYAPETPDDESAQKLLESVTANWQRPLAVRIYTEAGRRRGLVLSTGLSGSAVLYEIDIEKLALTRAQIKPGSTPEAVAAVTRASAGIRVSPNPSPARAQTRGGSPAESPAVITEQRRRAAILSGAAEAWRRGEVARAASIVAATGTLADVGCFIEAVNIKSCNISIADATQIIGLLCDVVSAPFPPESPSVSETNPSLSQRQAAVRSVMFFVDSFGALCRGNREVDDRIVDPTAEDRRRKCSAFVHAVTRFCEVSSSAKPPSGLAGAQTYWDSTLALTNAVKMSL